MCALFSAKPLYWERVKWEKAKEIKQYFTYKPFYLVEMWTANKAYFLCNIPARKAAKAKYYLKQGPIPTPFNQIQLPFTLFYVKLVLGPVIGQ